MYEADQWVQSELFPDADMKRCSGCGVLKPITGFHVNRSTRDGRQSRCRECNIEQAKQFHRDNLVEVRRRISAWVRRVDIENKRRVLDYLLDHPCVDCGEADPVLLEFDHRRDKQHGVAQLLQGHVRWEVIEAEIAKCEVRCANCHRRRTATEGGWFRTLARAPGRIRTDDPRIKSPLH